MGQKTSGHIRPCNVGNVEAHNERSQDYIENVKRSGKEIYFFPELSNRNSTWVNSEYGGKSCAQIFDEMKNLYREKKGQAPQLKEKERRNPKTGRTQKIAGWSPLREMVAVIKEDTKVEDFDYFRRWAESQGLQVVRIDIHKDEGHTDADDKFVGNFHAHVILDFLDKNTADTVKLGKEKMSEMQTVLAISLGMERGEKKEDTNREYMMHPEFKKMMREIDEVLKKLDDLKEEEKKALTRVKGLTTMIANLEKKQEELQEDIDHLQFDQNAMTAINEELDEMNKAKEKKNKEIDEKKEQLTTELAEIQAKLEDKNALLLKARQQLQDVADNRASLEKEYNALNPKFKKLQEQFNTSVKEQNQYLEERINAIEELNEDGLVNHYREKAEAYQRFLYRRFPFAKESVEAIAQKTISRAQRTFSPGQAVIIENAIGAHGEKGREDLAINLVEIARPEITELNGFKSANPKWVDQTMDEVIQIARHTHPYSSKLDAARAKAQESAGGGPSYITDLTDWSGNQIKL